MLIQTVRVALRRPYTFVVMALLLLIVGPLAALRTPTDIFPEIRIPVVAVAWQYTGLPPDQMALRQMPPASRHPSSSTTTPRRCPSCSWPCRAKACLNRACSTSA